MLLRLTNGPRAGFGAFVSCRRRFSSLRTEKTLDHAVPDGRPQNLVLVTKRRFNPNRWYLGNPIPSLSKRRLLAGADTDEIETIYGDPC